MLRISPAALEKMVPARLEQLGFLISRLFAWFVVKFQRLKRKYGRRDFASLAVPVKLDLALVLEENKTVFLRKRLVLIDQLDEVALLGVGESRIFRRRAVVA